jgi:beta-fructofuranosidase
VLSEALHEGRKIYDWRDPFVFHHQNRTFLVTGGNLNEAKGGQAVVNIYEAENPDLTRWKYRGILYQISDPQARTAECPNFFKLGDRWVLFVSPYGKVQYFVGDFDPASCRFQAHSRGLLDVGPHFYAPNTMQVPDSRRLVWGWVNGFPGGHGWNGCLSLPRLLSLSRDGQLRQSPAPQLTRLRGKSVEWRNIRLEPGFRPLTLPNTNTLEICAEIDLESAAGLVLIFKSGAGGARPVTISLSRPEFKMREADILIALNKNERILSLRLFIDRSVLEVFANGTVCATKVISPLDASATMDIQPQNGTAHAKRIQCWPMKSIW